MDATLRVALEILVQRYYALVKGAAELRRAEEVAEYTPVSERDMVVHTLLYWEKNELKAKLPQLQVDLIAAVARVVDIAKVVITK